MNAAAHQKCTAAEVSKMEYVGVDVATRSCSALILDEAGGMKMCLEEFANEESGWRALTEAIGPDAQIVMEAGTAAYPLYDFLCRGGFNVVMADPRKIKMITASKSKTDEKDAMALAHLLRLGYVPKAYVPTPDIMRNRELLRACVDVGQEITQTKNRIHAMLTKAGLRPEYRSSRNLFASRRQLEWLRSVRFGDHRDTVLQCLLMLLESLQGQRKLLKAQIARIGLSSREVNILMSIKGVDYYAALLIISEIGDIRRFRNADTLCAYAGLVPSVRQSAEVVSHGRITKRGPGTLRWILDVVAQVVVRYDNPMSAYYRRLVRRKKKRCVAITAVSRKLLVMMYAMLTRGERCRWEDAHLTDVKIMLMRRTCARKVSAG